MPDARFKCRARFVIIPVITLVCCVLAALPAVAAADPSSTVTCPRDGNPAVRADDPYAQRLIEYGIEHSPTFAAIVDALEDSDVVVIVESDPKLSLALNGYLVFISTTSACRYVRVRFTTRVPRNRAVPIIGHELQHALEVAVHPDVIDSASLREMYERIGQRSNSENSFESQEAERTGRIIGFELFHPTPAQAAADTDR